MNNCFRSIFSTWKSFSSDASSCKTGCVLYYYASTYGEKSNFMRRSASTKHLLSAYRNTRAENFATIPAPINARQNWGLRDQIGGIYGSSFDCSDCIQSNFKARLVNAAGAFVWHWQLVIYRVCDMYVKNLDRRAILLSRMLLCT